MKILKIIIFTCWLTLPLFAQDIDNPEITAKEIQEHINYLASDELEGRMTGSEGCYKAGEYIKDEFSKYGLKPLFNGSYYQEFDFIENVELTENNSLQISVKGDMKNLELGEDFITNTFSGTANINGNLVFAGYGISADKLEYDDYESLDVAGKIVVVMRFHPEYDSSTSEFDNYSSLRQKASTAKEKEALGILFVNGYFPENEEDKLTEFVWDRGPGLKDFAAVHIKRNFINELFQNENLDFANIQKEINNNKKPSSFEFKNVKITAKTEINEIWKIGRNVGGYLEGNDPDLKNEYIVIGAHYDHLGYGPHGSLYRGDEPMIHNGADDNASGTTGVMELAEKFADVKDQLKRSVIFCTFSGEELGLLGSAHLVNNFPVPIENVVTMLNMDMIGRVNEDYALTIIGSGTSSIWEDLLNNSNNYEFNLSLNDDGWGGSDHQSFTIKDIPVLFFFTGTHSDYHKPSDDADKINSSGEEDVVNFVFDIAVAVDQREEKPDFIKVERKQPTGRMTSKVYVGTVPEFGYQGEGYKLSGVSEGSPAQKGGLLGGDIITKFGEKKIANIYDFMYATNDYSPGDVVEITVLRDGKEVKLEVELGSK